MFSFGASCYKNSFIGRINPSIKFLIYIVFVAILFIPSSFAIQIVFCLFVYLLFFMARLPQRMFWRTLLSVLIILFFLFLINWFTYRNPGFFILNSSITQLGSFNDNNASNLFSIHITAHDNFFYIDGQQISREGFVDNYVIFPKTSSGSVATLTPEEVYAAFENKHIYVGALWGVPNTSGWNAWYKFQVSNGSILPVCHVKPYALSWRTFVISVYVFFKIFTLIILSTLLTATTTSIELTYALEDLLAPLKIFRFPVNEFAMILAITIRYIPTLLIEAHRIMNAQSARGVDFKNGGLKDKINSITSLVIPMFSVAFRKADELAFAMEARGYNPRYLRSRYRYFSLKFSDILIFAFVIAILCFFIVINIKNVWIAPFGSFDWLVLYAKNLKIV